MLANCILNATGHSQDHKMGRRDYEKAEAQGCLMERHPFHSICPYFAMFPNSSFGATCWRGQNVTTLFWTRFQAAEQRFLKACSTAGKGSAATRTRWLFALPREGRSSPARGGLGSAAALAEGKHPFQFQKRPRQRTNFSRLLSRRDFEEILFLRKSWTGVIIGQTALSPPSRWAVFTAKAIARSFVSETGCPGRSARNPHIRSVGGMKKDVYRRSVTFSRSSAHADYRYQSPLPSLKGRVVEGDVRRAGTLLRSYREK